MNLILLGPPGAGKGTQSQYVCGHYKIPQISTGDILREARKNRTEMGKKADEYMSAGKLVPDEVVIGIVDERLKRDDCKRGFVLDGFPRTTAQADALGALLKKRGTSIQAVVNMIVPDELIITRLSGRRVCGECGATFHAEFSPPQRQGFCDKCGGALIQRKDDSEATVAERLKVYRDQTQPLVSYYDRERVLKTIDGTGEVSDVWQRLKGILDNLT